MSRATQVEKEHQIYCTLHGPFLARTAPPMRLLAQAQGRVRGGGAWRAALVLALAFVVLDLAQAAVRRSKLRSKLERWVG